MARTYPEVKVSRKTQIKGIRRARLAREAKQRVDHKEDLLNDAREVVERGFKKRASQGHSAGLGAPQFSGFGDGVRDTVPDGRYKLVDGELVPV